MPHGKAYARKPAVILLCASVYFLNTLANIALRWRDSGLPPMDFARKFVSLVTEARDPYTIAMAALWALAPIVFAGIVSVRGWGWILFLIHALATGASGILDERFAFRGLSVYVFVDLPFLAAAAFYLFSEIRSLYFNSRLRWWERLPRYRDAIRVGLEEGGRYVMFDISEKGIFIADAHASSRRIGERLTARIDLGDDSMTAKIKIVRLHPGGGDYPPGFGSLFMRMNGASRNLLRAYINELEAALRKSDGTQGRGARANGPFSMGSAS